MPKPTDVRRRVIVTFVAFGALTIVACLLAPLVGSTRIDLARVFDRSIPFADNTDAQVFFVARLPRVVAAAIVGAGLSLSGVVFQALLRNPLAAPDTLGISAGATLGAMLVLTAHADFTLLGVSVVPLATFAGAVGALAIVFVLYTLAASRPRRISVPGLAVCLLVSVPAVTQSAAVDQGPLWAAVVGAGGITLTAWVLGDAAAYRRAYYVSLEDRLAVLG